MTEYLPIARIAEAVRLVPRAIERAIERVRKSDLATWRGARLVFRTVPGRGGRSGVNYEIRVDSLPGEIQERLKRRLLPVPASTPTPEASDTARLERDLRFHVISRVVAHPKGSEARAAAAREEAARPILNPRTNQFELVSVATIMRWVKRHESHGEAGLGRKRRADAGAKRVIVTLKWDAAVSFDDEQKDRIAAELRQYVRSHHKNLTSFGHMRVMAEKKLAARAVRRHERPRH